MCWEPVRKGVGGRVVDGMQCTAVSSTYLHIAMHQRHEKVHSSEQHLPCNLIVPRITYS